MCVFARAYIFLLVSVLPVWAIYVHTRSRDDERNAKEHERTNAAYLLAFGKKANFYQMLPMYTCTPHTETEERILSEWVSHCEWASVSMQEKDRPWFTAFVHLGLFHLCLLLNAIRKGEIFTTKRSFHAKICSKSERARALLMDFPYIILWVYLMRTYYYNNFGHSKCCFSWSAQNIDAAVFFLLSIMNFGLKWRNKWKSARIFNAYSIYYFLSFYIHSLNMV